MGKRGKKEPNTKRKIIRYSILAVIILLIALPFLIHRNGELPSGMHTRGQPVPVEAEDLSLLIDSTAFDEEQDERIIKQEIFDAILAVIDEADTFIYMDFFLWNGWQGSIPEDHRKLSTQLADALIRKKIENPDIRILAMTDPINRIYGSDESEFYRRMAAAGIPIIFTTLDRLPDSNLLYAAPAETYGRLIARIPPLRKRLYRRTTSNPFVHEGDRIKPRQIASLLKFKANHRKLIVADHEDGRMRTIVMSFNPADGSSAHSNIGLKIIGPLAFDALRSELACVEWSAESNGVLEEEPGQWSAVAAYIRSRIPEEPQEPSLPDVGQRTVEWNSEAAIRERLLTMLGSAGPGDAVRIAVFYLSDRDVVRAIRDAAVGGSSVRVILDPNRDAFGRKKNGVPNRPVAAELLEFVEDTSASLSIRWADTHGEQFHTKAISVTNHRQGKYEFMCGSANWTRRNLQDLNLEANVYAANAPELVEEFNTYFDKAWANNDGLSHTVPYEDFAETGFTLWKKKWLYRIQEATGLSTF